MSLQLSAWLCPLLNANALQRLGDRSALSFPPSRDRENISVCTLTGAAVVILRKEQAARARATAARAKILPGMGYLAIRLLRRRVVTSEWL